MKSYLDELKEMYLNSEKIAILFKDKQLIWTNKTKNFFNGKIPAYSEILIDNSDNPCELPIIGVIHDISFKFKNSIFKAKLVEKNIKDEGVYSTVIIDLNADCQKDSEFDLLNQWFDIKDYVFGIVITKMTTILQSMLPSQTINDIIMQFRCLMFFDDFGRLILNTSKYGQEYSDKKLINLFDTIYKIASHINNDYNINIEFDFKTTTLSRVFVLYNLELLKKIVLYSIKYTLRLSGSNRCNISNNKLTEEEYELIIKADKDNDKKLSMIENMELELMKSELPRFCRFMGISFKEENNDKTVSLIFKFNVSHDINKFESNFDLRESTGLYSDYNRIFYDYVIKGDFD